MNKHFTWKKYHRWFGLVLSVFMLVFCVSGIILNHRQLFADCAVSRSLLPPAYHIRNFNNGIIKGSTPIASGHPGVWLCRRMAYRQQNAKLGGFQQRTSGTNR